MNAIDKPSATPSKRHWSQFSVRPWTISIALIGGMLIAVLIGENFQALYSKHVGARLILIKSGSESSEGGAVKRVLLVYYDTPLDLALMTPFASHHIPVDARPVFATVEDANLVCVYDTTDLGFVLIVDKNSDDWYVADLIHMRGGIRGTPLSIWLDRYRDLKERFPDLPYEDRFLELSKHITQ